jgi:phosphoenolpyruvate phosphomutase
MRADTPAQSKSARLRALLASRELEFLMEAHNGISARIVEEAGFKGIWASGLALSAQFAVRDSNEASWTQIVDMLEFMSDATSIPILLDGDTGYGDFNNMRRLVKKLGQRDIAGVCIEDKLFPKRNSLLPDERQPLADIAEFCGKIKAGKDSQSDPDFVIVARVEALIANRGMDEALERAESYREAGADAILIHSKEPRPNEVLTFAQHWDRRHPLVIVPTRYYTTPTDAFRKAGVSVVIWANHVLRSAVAHMTAVARQVHKDESVAGVEDHIARVSEIFRLQGEEELSQAERRYVASEAQTHAIVLAATRGAGLESVTEDRPKVMLPIAGKPLLAHLVDQFQRQAIQRITVVAGYRAEAIDVGGVRVLHNPDYMRSGELASLACARDAIHDDVIVTYGDLLFRRHVLRDLVEARGDLVAVVDSELPPQDSRDYRDLAYCSRDDHPLLAEEADLERVSDRPDSLHGKPSGRWIGILRARGHGRERLLEALEVLRSRRDFAQLGMPDLMNALIGAGHTIKVVYIHGHWINVNAAEDLIRGSDFAYGPMPPGGAG